MPRRVPNSWKRARFCGYFAHLFHDMHLYYLAGGVDVVILIMKVRNFPSSTFDNVTGLTFLRFSTPRRDWRQRHPNGCPIVTTGPELLLSLPKLCCHRSATQPDGFLFLTDTNVVGLR